MAQIYNSELIKELREGAGIQQNRDFVPNQLAEKVVPVMEVNPKLTKPIDYASSSYNTTSGSIIGLTTPTYGKDFYLTNLTVNYIKDSTCDTATGSLTVSTTVGSKTSYLMIIPIITLTAQTHSQTIHYNPPIKIDKGATIILTGSWAAGVCSRAISIAGVYAESLV